MSAPTYLARMRLVSINDVYNLTNLPKLQTFLSTLSELPPSAVLLAGDFCSPSTLSSLDGGRGMVATLRATGITHACLGNHEADLVLPNLQRRLQKLSKSATVINSNVGRGASNKDQEWIKSMLPTHSIITSPCKRVKIALLGLLSDEEGVFRGNTFRGLEIDNVLDTYDSLHKELIIDTKVADTCIPMTHQSVSRDVDLAHHMLELGRSPGIIIGGHEHEPINKTITTSNGEHHVKIIKSGTEAQHASLIDLVFDISPQEQGQPAQIVDIEYKLEDVRPLPESIVVQKIVDKHMSVLETMKQEVLIDSSTEFLPPGKALSSVGTRHKQTSVGAMICQAIKDELEVDAAIINGGSVKGNQTYDNHQMTYAQLQAELPFPTKIVVVEMKRHELNAAIRYSRKHVENDAKTDSKRGIERRGYLQVDLDYELLEGNPGGDRVDDDVLTVALPRNLMAGFCRIQPLMDLGDELKRQGKFPHSDDYVPGIDLVVRHACKTRWYDLIQDNSVEDLTFDDLDLNDDGVLDRSEIKKLMERVLGYEPADFVVDDMIKSIDEDDNGVIDRGELSYLLATMEREKENHFHWRQNL